MINGCVTKCLSHNQFNIDIYWIKIVNIIQVLILYVNLWFLNRKPFHHFIFFDMGAQIFIITIRRPFLKILSHLETFILLLCHYEHIRNLGVCNCNLSHDLNNSICCYQVSNIRGLCFYSYRSQISSFSKLLWTWLQ